MWTWVCNSSFEGKINPYMPIMGTFMDLLQGFRLPDNPEVTSKVNAEMQSLLLWHTKVQYNSSGKEASPQSVIWTQSFKPTWRKETTDPHKLSSDDNICSSTHIMHTQREIHNCNK